MTGDQNFYFKRKKKVLVGRWVGAVSYISTRSRSCIYLGFIPPFKILKHFKKKNILIGIKDPDVVKWTGQLSRSQTKGRPLVVRPSCSTPQTDWLTAATCNFLILLELLCFSFPCHIPPPILLPALSARNGPSDRNSSSGTALPFPLSPLIHSLWKKVRFK